MGFERGRTGSHYTLPMRLLPLFAVSLCATAALAQTASPLTADAKKIYDITKRNILASVDKLPEDKFAYKPTDGVRTYAQLLGHIGDANYGMCAAAKGETRERSTIEKTTSTRTAMTEALKGAFAYCDSVFDSMTDAKGAETVKFFLGTTTRLGVLSFNSAHNMEHYGNLVTYMRMNGVVPPSSEPRR